MKRFLPAAVVACTASAHPIESSADVQQGSYVKHLESTLALICTIADTSRA